MPPEITAQLAQQIVTFLLGGGALGLVAGISRFIWKLRTGRIASENSRNKSLVDDRVQARAERKEAEKERDEANVEKRILVIDNTRLRVLLMKNGIDPGDEPDIAETRPTTPRSRRGKASAE